MTLYAEWLRVSGQSVTSGILGGLPQAAKVFLRSHMVNRKSLYELANLRQQLSEMIGDSGFNVSEKCVRGNSSARRGQQAEDRQRLRVLRMTREREATRKVLSFDEDRGDQQADDHSADLQHMAFMITLNKQESYIKPNKSGHLSRRDVNLLKVYFTRLLLIAIPLVPAHILWPAAGADMHGNVPKFCPS